MYDLHELRDKHLVNFSSVNIYRLHYYDFYTKSWIPCSSVERLPYDLCAYTLDKIERSVVVTSQLSYRLHNYSPDFPFPSDDYMLQERSWREELCSEGMEVDVCTSSDEWVKAKVAWLKSDIVPGVLHLKHKNGESIGYYYKESKDLARTCTYTDEEKLQDEEVEESYVLNKQKERDIRNGLKLMVIPKRFQNDDESSHQHYDYLPFYNQLVKADHEITDQELIDAGVIDIDNVKSIKGIQRCIIMFLSNKVNDKRCDIYYHTHSVEFKKEKNELFSILECTGDAMCDFTIEGLTPDNCTNIHMTIHQNEDIVICAAIWKNSGVYSFTDFTIDNPLIYPISGSRYYIDIEGISGDVDATKLKLTYKIVYFDYKTTIVHNIIRRENSLWAITKIPSKKSYLFAGHLWMPSFMIDEKEITFK